MPLISHTYLGDATFWGSKSIRHTHLTHNIDYFRQKNTYLMAITLLAKF
ncbi:MAG: hypothetical protein IPL33_00995 [Sphingobacteriales bacterium]|nr:hypothetical protein [Sphingobacteriales bacterium]